MCVKLFGAETTNKKLGLHNYLEDKFPSNVQHSKPNVLWIHYGWPCSIIFQHVLTHLFF